MEWTPDGFDALARPQIEPAFRLARIMLGNYPDAEDAVQEALARAWSRIHQLREPAAFRPWFLAIVANHCRSTRRAFWRRRGQTAEPGDRPQLPADSDPEDVVGRLDLRTALRRLSLEDRTALLLFYALDLPLEEVAATLGVSPAAAKSRIFRAAGRLRLELTAEVPR